MNNEGATGRPSGFNRQKPGAQQVHPEMPNQFSEIETILAELARSGSVQKIRPASMWAMKLALLASREEGISGEIRILIPAKTTHPVEASFSTQIAS